MKKFIPFLLLIFLFASSSSYALDFIKFGTDHDEDFWGTPDSIFPNFPSTVEYLQARGKNQITSVDLSNQNVQDAFNGAFGPFDAIVVSEEIEDDNDLTPETYALINQFVSDGGCFILTGDHGTGGGEDVFLNDAFGYNVSVTPVSDDPPDLFAIQPKSSNAFANGPPILLGANATAAFSNTPGTTIYSGPVGVGVFTDQFGQGNVTAIGWDYCCDPPDSIRMGAYSYGRSIGNSRIYGNEKKESNCLKSKNISI